MSGMSTNRQTGFVSGLLLPLIFVSVLFTAALVFGVWAFVSRQDYKLHSDNKAAVAVAAAKEATQKEDAVKYADESKKPLKTHIGPEAFGAVSVMYPKTWSAYVIEHTGNTGVPMNDYFHPDVVKDTSDLTTAYALRVQVVSSTYSQVMAQYQSLANSKKVTVTPYKLPKVPTVVGSRVDGQITAQKQGSMIILPVRNVTLQISTESQDFLDDFNTRILPNLSFAP